MYIYVCVFETESSREQESVDERVNEKEIKRMKD